MKAVYVREFGPPEVLILEELEDPKPGFAEVVVKLHAVGVNPVDTYLRSGYYSPGPVPPYVPGMDGAGVVEVTGEGVKKVVVGERVYVAGSLSGTYAEKTLCKESQVYPIPDKISFEQGAGVNVPYTAAYHALFNRANARRGETVLVHGADGGVGIASVQLAKAAGIRVIGTCSSDRGQQLVREQGADYVLDHNSPAHLGEIMNITEGRGVDAVLEMLANVNLGKDLGILADNGRVVIIGSRGSVEINPREIMSRNAAVLGMMILKLSERQLQDIHSALAEGLKNGTVRPMVGKRFPLSEAARAHHEIIEGVSYGKMVLIP